MQYLHWGRDLKMDTRKWKLGIQCFNKKAKGRGIESHCVHGGPDV